MKFTEDQLREYAKPISKTEEVQCENAVKMVADALKELGLKESDTINKMYPDTPSYQLRMSGGDGYDIKIFLQGSYANNTNVRRNSDVDIAVVMEDRFITKYRENVCDGDYRFIKVKSRNIFFKDEVERVLRKKFGNDVVRKNKSIRINGNSYRKDADTVPSIRYRDYSRDYIINADNYTGGILIIPDQGNKIINYPEQHMQNGIEKNKRTHYYFKKMVRIAKEMRYRMIEEEYRSAKDISSFLVECLVWNVPDELFIKYSSYGFIFEEVINYLYNNQYLICIFEEVNGIKSIGQDDKARIEYCKNFVEELKRFYEYEF